MHPISSRHAVAVVQAAAKERLSDPVRGYPKEFEDAVYRELAEIQRTRPRLMAVTPKQALKRILAFLGLCQHLGASEERQPAPPRLTVTACGMATKIALGALATTLAVSAAIPAFASKPDNTRHGGQHAQRQEQGVSAAGKGKRNRSRTVKKTFASDSPIAIPAINAVDEFGPADAYPATIAVNGFKRKSKITDVNVSLRGFSHEVPAEVDVLLVAPGGRNAVVMGDVGDRAEFDPEVADLTLTLDDEAAEALPAEALLTSGSFRPFDTFGLVDTNEPSLLDFPAPAPAPSGHEALSTFDGIDPSGEWQLFILDDSEGDVGSLSGGWELKITARAKTKGKRKR